MKTICCIMMFVMASGCAMDKITLHYSPIGGLTMGMIFDGRQILPNELRDDDWDDDDIDNMGLDTEIVWDDDFSLTE